MSSTSADMYVKGRSLRLASISTTTASKTGKVTKDLPNVFLRACLVKPISLSQKPPYHGALLGMNCHVTPWYSRAYLREGNSNNCCSSSAAAK